LGWTLECWKKLPRAPPWVPTHRGVMSRGGTAVDGVGSPRAGRNHELVSDLAQAGCEGRPAG